MIYMQLFCLLGNHTCESKLTTDKKESGRLLQKAFPRLS